MTDIFPGAALRQLVEWGYPQRTFRPVPDPDKAFSVIHITGNSRLPSAENEVAWRINDQALQNSATFFVNRNGSIVQALGDPLFMDPWANGDVNRPDLSNPRIAALARDGVNANERTIVAIENVGYEPGFAITSAQEQACAAIVAYYHAKAGVPVNRQTVIGHYQLNSVSRPNCPGVNKALIDRIVAGATTELPDTSIEDEMPKILERIKGEEAVISRSGIPLRTAPTLADADIYYRTAVTNEQIQPYAVVEGSEYGVSGGVSTRYLAYVTSNRAHGYLPEVYAERRPITPDTSAFDTKIERAVTSARGARRAIAATIQTLEE